MSPKWFEDVVSGDTARMRESFPWAPEMIACPQDVLYHAEGDVWTHTMMVLANVENRVGNLEGRPEGLMRLTAMFHDSAKPECTVHEWCDTEKRMRVRQPNHARKGMEKAWRWMIDAGEDVHMARELSGLVFWHQRPSHMVDQKNVEARISRFVAEGGRWDRLLALCESDQTGRISPNVEEGMIALGLVQLDVERLSENMGYDLMRGEAPDSGEWRMRMGESWNGDPFYAPPDEEKNVLTIMSGLPGSGKSTWVRENAGDAVVISLDQIRSEFARYKRNQEYEGKCYQEAVKRLREALAAKRDVIWDACCLDERSRNKAQRLGRDYGSNLRVISIDEPYAVCARRNADREHPVPKDAMEKMAASREMVLSTEGHEVFSMRDGVMTSVSRRPEETAPDAPQP